MRVEHHSVSCEGLSVSYEGTVVLGTSANYCLICPVFSLCYNVGLGPSPMNRYPYWVYLIIVMNKNGVNIHFMLGVNIAFKHFIVGQVKNLNLIALHLFTIHFLNFDINCPIIFPKYLITSHIGCPL